MLIGHFGIKRTPDFPDFFALRVMNDILGEGGFTSRLMREVREKHGLAYMVGSIMQTSYYTNPGEWFAYSQTRTEKTAEAISLIVDVVKGLRDTPVPAAELQRTKDSLINSFVFGFESSSQIAFQQMMLDYRGYAPGFLETLPITLLRSQQRMCRQSHRSISIRTRSRLSLSEIKRTSTDRLMNSGDVNEIEIEQPAPPPPAEPMPEASEDDMAKAKEIIAMAVDAHGGLEKLQAVKNIVVEGRTAANSPMGPMNLDVKVYQVYPNKLRQDIKMPQGEMSVAFDGTSGFALTPMGPQPLPPEMTASLKDGIFREPVWLLVNLMQDGSSNTLAQKR